MPRSFAYWVRTARASNVGVKLIKEPSIEYELTAGSHAPECFSRQAEIRGLAPGSDGLIGLAPEFRRIDDRQIQRSIVQHHGDGGRCVNIAGLPVISGGNVYPQAIAQHTAAIPFDRAQVGEARAPAQDEHHVLRAWHEFNRFFECADGYRAALVQHFDGFGGRLAGAPGDQSN
jgi:hypothetical protein